MIRFIAGIRSSKHLAASWSGVRGNGVRLRWAGQWGSGNISRNHPSPTGRASLWRGRLQESTAELETQKHLCTQLREDF